MLAIAAEAAHETISVDALRYGAQPGVERRAASVQFPAVSAGAVLVVGASAGPSAAAGSGAAPAAAGSGAGSAVVAR